MITLNRKRDFSYTIKFARDINSSKLYKFKDEKLKFSVLNPKNFKYSLEFGLKEIKSN